MNKIKLLIWGIVVFLLMSQKVVAAFNVTTLNQAASGEIEGAQITYTYETSMSNYCPRINSNGYWLEIKYGKDGGVLLQGFSSLLNVSIGNTNVLTLNDGNGWASDQATANIIYVNSISDIKFKLTFTPISLSMVYGESDIVEGSKIAQVWVYCRSMDPYRTPPSSYKVVNFNQMRDDYGSNQYNYEQNGIKATIIAENTVSLSKTCSLKSAKNQTIKLRDVSIGELNRSSEVDGGNNFVIQLNCQTAAVQDAFISFTDGTTPTNTSDLLTIETGDGQATGVKLKVYQNNSPQAIMYDGKSSHSQFAFTTDPGMTRFVASNVAGESSVSKQYNVNYVKTGTVTPGAVHGKLIYNLYYK